MKWFKHLTTSIDDPFIFDLISKFGGDGYLLYFGTVEIMAREFQPERPEFCEISLKFLSKKLQLSARFCLKCLNFCSEKGKIFYQINGDQISLNCPKLVTLCDEFTQRAIVKKSGVNRESIGQNSIPDKDTDKDTDKELKAVSVDDRPFELQCPHQEIIKIYHETLPKLPKVAKWTTKRAKHLSMCWKDENRQTLEWWRSYFQKVRGSPFLIGENDRGWIADLEWLTIESNLVKVVEGKYANSTGRGKGNSNAGFGKPEPTIIPEYKGDDLPSLTPEQCSENARRARELIRGIG